MDDDYELVRGTPDPETFCALREAAGLSARSIEGARRGLPNTLFGVRAERGGEVVGMARVVGDGGTAYEIVDVAVDPAHQGRGLGSAMVEELVDYLDREAPPRAYVSLLADVDGFYERWGFERTAPGSRGMFRRVDADGRFGGGDSGS